MALVVVFVVLSLLAMEETRAALKAGLRLELKVTALHQVLEGRAAGRAEVRGE